MQHARGAEKDHNVQLAMTGATLAFKTKDDWLKHFRPWVVFGLDPKPATATATTCAPLPAA